MWLYRLDPKRPLILTDYAPATVARLGDLFPEADVRLHNLSTDRPLEADVHLFHRIDTEFTNREWHSIFCRFSGRTILMVATEQLGLRSLVRELLTRLSSKNATRAGLIRNRAAFEALWKETHESEPIRIGGLSGWALRPKSGTGR